MNREKRRERVLVLGDDMRIFLAVVRSLGRAGKEVHAAPFNWHSPALTSKYISKIHNIPRYSDGAEAWRNSVVDVLHKDAVDLVMPCCDRAILALDKHRKELEGYPIAIPSSAAISVLFDKAKTRKLCTELGIPVAEGRLVGPRDSAQTLCRRFHLPLVLKSRRSYWLDKPDRWAKVWIVETETALQELLDNPEDRSRYLVEARFDGDGVGVSVLAHEGTILQAFQHRRLREGKTGSSSYRVSEPVDKELHSACEKICRHTGLTGVCMFEFRHNPKSGRWILLETNARFWGSLPLPLSLGVDFPRFLYDLLVHQVHHPAFQYRSGVTARNLLFDGYNLLAGLRDRNFGGWIRDLGNFLCQPMRWLTGEERSDTFVADDLRPALWEFAVLLRDLSSKRWLGRNPQPSRRSYDSAPAVAAIGVVTPETDGSGLVNS